MKNLLYFINITLLFLFISCSDEDQINYQTDSSHLITERNNPFDNAGLIHNEALDYLATSYNTESSEISLKLIAEYVSSKKEFRDVDYPFKSKSGVAIEYDSGANGYNSVKEYLDKNKEKFKAIDIEYLYSLGELVDKYRHDHQDLNILEKDILSLEHKISNDKRAISKAMLLGTASVGLHSAKYWKDYSINPKNLFRKIKPVGEVQSRWVHYCTGVDMVAYASTYNDFYYGMGYSSGQSDYYAISQAAYESALCME